jgi:hypothetical protein
MNIGYCKKYEKWISKKEEEQRYCLRKFEYNGVFGICPNLLTRPQGERIYHVIHPKTNKEKDFWKEKIEEWNKLMKAIEEIQKKGIFNI